MGTTDAAGGTAFWSTVFGLMRRGRVLLPALLVASTLGGIAFLSTPKTYVSNTTMVLATNEYGGSESQDPTQPSPLINPMLNFNDSLRTTSAILIQAMGTRDVLERLGATGGSTHLIVNDGRTNPELLGLNGPFLYIEGRSVSAEDARHLVVAAQALMQQELSQWQSTLNAPAKTYVRLVPVVPPTIPVASAGRAIKLGMVAFVFGFVLCVAVAYAGHQLRLRRRTRPRRGELGGAVPPDDVSGHGAGPLRGPPATVPMLVNRKTSTPTADPRHEPEDGPRSKLEDQPEDEAEDEAEAEPEDEPGVEAGPSARIRLRSGTR